MFLTACGSTTERIVRVPEIVTETIIEQRDVPSELTEPEQLAHIPSQATYRELLMLWVEDRRSLLTANAKLDAIRNLSESE